MALRLSLAATLLLAIAAPSAFAAPPDPCTLISMEEVNKMARNGDALHVQKRASASTSECVYLDKGKSAVLTIEIRDSKDPAGDLKYDVSVAERAYKKKTKPLTGIGDEAVYIDHIWGAEFRKGKRIGYLYFTGSKYGGEPVVVAVAKLIASRLN